LQRGYFTKHLYDEHQISELANHPNCEFLKKNFTICVEMQKGKCNFPCEITCKKDILYDERGLYLLENHYEMFHKNARLFRTAVKTKNGEAILNNFLIENKIAICSFCTLQFNIEHLDVFAADILIKLAKHYFGHDRYEDNFLIFVKTTEN